MIDLRTDDMNKLHRQLLHYGVALMAVLSAAVLARQLRPLTSTASPLFLAAVTLSSLYGGLGPGLVATALSALALDSLVLPPINPRLTGIAEAARLGVFGLVAVLISSLHAARRSAEQALTQTLAREQAALAEAEAANSCKDQFLTFLGHELRTPLATVRNVIEVLVQKSPEGSGAEWGRGILERQVNRMSRLLEDLLDLARVSRGKTNLRQERLDLTHLLRTTAEDHRRSIEQSGLTFRVELPAAAVWVVGDPTRLAQVTSNLLDNAGKFTDSGGSISLRLATTEGDRWAAVSVRDTGSGIEPELVPHIFDLFVQAKRTRDRSRGGLGLGLALVKGLVELHGGKVAASSKGLGRGTDFTIWLPLHQEPDAVGAKTSAPSARAVEIESA